MRLGRWLGLGCFALASAFAAADDFTLTILHTNDMHAHVEATKVGDHVLGGYPRQATLIKRLRAESVNPILLNAGDTFQGTLYFNAYVGLADLAFMNLAGYDAMCAGNHEFDRGPGPFGEFIRRAQFPVLCANVDFSQEPTLAGLVKPSTVLTVGHEMVGVVGAVTPTLPSISSPGDKIKMLDMLVSVQAEIDRLNAAGVNKIIVLSHVGYSEEVEMAKALRGVDVIVGGHSHTLLGECNLEGISGRGGYPTVVQNADGDTALVVQAWEWGKVVGRMVVIFDEAGKVKSWPVASPVPVTQDIAPDPLVASVIDAFSKPIESLKNQPIAESSEAIVRAAVNGESAVGNLIADAMLEATKQTGSVAAFMNAGGVRADIPAGQVTYGDLIAVQPFNNTLTVLELKGSEIKAALEHGFGNGGQLYTSAGTTYTVDASKPAGQRIVNVTIAGQPLDLNKTYRVTTNSFTAGGGDGHEAIKNAAGYREDTGLLDIDALIDYVKKTGRIESKLEGRIKVNR